MSTRVPRLVGTYLLIGSWLLLACGGRDDGDDGDDMATPPEHFVADSRPILSVGTGESGFGQVATAVWLSDGVIAVGDAHNRHVRLFDPDGTERAIAGRRGEGPGEFESIDRMWRVGSDSVAVWDARLLRYSVIGNDGGVGRSVSLELTGERARPTPLGFSADGHLVAVDDPREMPEEERYRATLRLIEYDADGALRRTIASFPGDEMWNWVWEMGVTPSTVPFGKPTVVHLFGDAVLVGTNEAYAVDRYDLFGPGSPAEPASAIRLDRDARSLPDALVERYLAAERAKASSGAAAKGGNDIFGMMAEDAPYPETLPHYDAILTDDAGNVWVRDYVTDPDAATFYRVFGPDGEPVGTAELPARFRATDIAGGQVLGVWRDELDVEQVRIYAIR